MRSLRSIRNMSVLGSSEVAPAIFGIGGCSIALLGDEAATALRWVSADRVGQRGHEASGPRPGPLDAAPRRRVSRAPPPSGPGASGSAGRSTPPPTPPAADR